MHLTLQGIIPTEAEGRVIRKLTESQFSQLSPRDDVLVEDPDLATGVDMLTLTVHSSITYKPFPFKVINVFHAS